VARVVAGRTDRTTLEQDDEGMVATMPQPAGSVSQVGGTRLKRIGLASFTALLSLNVWTGGPLLAVWVGSKAQGSSTSLGMTSVFIVIVVLAVVEGLLLLGLAWANTRYDELIGRPPVRRRYPWLSSMRGERQEVIAKRQGISGLERIVVVSVVAGAAVFEFWFFFLAGSSLPNG
jgi:hypothetical protein